MKHPSLILCLVVLFPVGLLHSAVDFPQIELLRPELEKFATSLKGEQRAGYGREIGPALQGLLAQIARDMAEGNYDSAEPELRQLRQMAPTPTVIRLIDEMVTAVKTLREEHHAALVAKADVFVARTAETCLKAVDIREFDSLLVDLAETQAGLNKDHRSEALQRAARKLESAIHHARRWQDFLEQRRAGNDRAAIQIMTELANSGHLFPILPRSELLARTRPVAVDDSKPVDPAKPPNVAAEINSLADLPAAIEKLKAIGGAPNSEANQLLMPLRQLLSGVRALERGELGVALQHVTGGFYGNPDHEDLLIKPRQELIVRILPQLVVAPENLAPQAGENPLTYLSRVLQQAKTNKDWLLALRALDALNRVAYSSTNAPDWIQQDRSALGFYVGGLNQEKAGETAAALNSYRAAIKTPSGILPVDDVAARIKALARETQRETDRQAHPR